MPDGWSGYDDRSSRSLGRTPRCPWSSCSSRTRLEFACQETLREPAVGPSVVDDLVAALTFLPGLDAAADTDRVRPFDAAASRLEYSHQRGVGLHAWRRSTCGTCRPSNSSRDRETGGDRKSATARDGRILDRLDVDGERFIIRVDLGCRGDLGGTGRSCAAIVELHRDRAPADPTPQPRRSRLRNPLRPEHVGAGASPRGSRASPARARWPRTAP